MVRLGQIEAEQAQHPGRSGGTAPRPRYSRKYPDQEVAGPGRPGSSHRRREHVQ